MVKEVTYDRDFIMPFEKWDKTWMALHTNEVRFPLTCSCNSDPTLYNTLVITYKVVLYLRMPSPDKYYFWENCIIGVGGEVCFKTN